MLHLYGWVGDLSFEVFSDALGGEAPPDASDQQAAMAADIAEMRPFLVKNFKPERTVVQVTENLYLAWIWCLDHLVGAVVGGTSEREVLSHVARGVSPLIAGVGMVGAVQDWHLPWVRLDRRDGGVGASLRIVEAMHEKLFSFFDQLDLDAILRKPMPEGEADDEQRTQAEDEVIAASVEVLRRRDPDHSRRLSLRVQQLLSVLDGLGCEVRQGKGSEITVYRRGGKIFTLGHHKRNPRVGWSLIRRMLKQVGVTIEEWVAAIG